MSTRRVLAADFHNDWLRISTVLVLLRRGVRREILFAMLGALAGLWMWSTPEDRYTTSTALSLTPEQFLYSSELAPRSSPFMIAPDLTREARAVQSAKSIEAALRAYSVDGDQVSYPVGDGLSDASLTIQAATERIVSGLVVSWRVPSILDLRLTDRESGFATTFLPVVLEHYIAELPGRYSKTPPQFVPAIEVLRVPVLLAGPGPPGLGAPLIAGAVFGWLSWLLFAMARVASIRPILEPWQAGDVAGPLLDTIRFGEADSLLLVAGQLSSLASASPASPLTLLGAAGNRTFPVMAESLAEAAAQCGSELSWPNTASGVPIDLPGLLAGNGAFVILVEAGATTEMTLRSARNAAEACGGQPRGVIFVEPAR